MAKNLVEFITALAKKSGLKMDDEKLVAFLGNEALAAIEVPDEIATIDNKLITIADAKNNHPEIKPHYYGQTMAIMDKKLEKMLDDYQLDDQTRAELIAETNTYKRVDILSNAIKASEGKKGVTDKDAKAAFQKQVDETMAKLRATESERDSDKKSYEKQIKDFKLGHEKTQLFSGYKTVYDDLPVEVRNLTLLNLLDKELQDNSAAVDYDDNQSLALRKKDGTNYYGENNVQINHKQFVEQMLSKHKLLKVTDKNSNNSNGSQGQNNGQQRQIDTGGKKDFSGQLIRSLNEQAIKDSENANAFGM